MKPIPVSWISTYLYCKRKLYLEEVKEMRVPHNKYVIKGNIRHKIFDRINTIDEEIVRSIKTFMKKEDILMLFRKRYFEEVNKILKEDVMKLSSIGLNTTDYFHEIWKSILAEATLRSENIFGFLVKEKVYSAELWAKLFPKYLSEVELENEDLKGIIDRIEVYPSGVIPVELKSSKGPKEGVWPGDRVQVESYMILAEGEFGRKVSHGFVNYLESGEIRRVPNNEFVKDFVGGILDNIEETLKGKLPDFVKNKNKCTRCPLKDKCYATKA